MCGWLDGLVVGEGVGCEMWEIGVGDIDGGGWIFGRVWRGARTL